MTIVLIVTSIPYYLWLSIDSSKTFGGFLRTLYTDVPTSGFWYLYAYIGFLIMLPFLRSMVKNMKDSDYKYLFYIHLTLNVFIHIIDGFIFTGGHNDFITIPIVLETNIFYPLMGYYIDKNIVKNKFNNKNYILATLFSIASIAITCVISEIYYRINGGIVDYSLLQTFFDMLISIPALTAFFVIKGISNIKSTSIWFKIICSLGGSVFGLFLIEKICRAIVAPIYSFMQPYLGEFMSTIFMIILAMLLGFLVIYPIKNIPYLKSIVNKFI